MCPLLAPVLIGFFFGAAVNSTNEANKQPVHAVKQFILIRCLCLQPTQLASKMSMVIAPPMWHENNFNKFVN